MSRKIFLLVVLLLDEDSTHKPEGPAPVDNPPYEVPLHPGKPKIKGGIVTNAKRGENGRGEPPKDHGGSLNHDSQGIISLKIIGLLW